MLIRKGSRFSSGIIFSAGMVISALILLVLGSQFSAAKQAAPEQSQANWNWDEYGGHPDESHYVQLDQINKSNVKQLKIAWTYPTQDELSYLFNPIEADGVLYALARDNSLVAINASNGKEIWVHAGMAGISQRGISYWQSKDGKDRRLIFTIHNQIQEIDATTGRSILGFGTDGFVDLRIGLDRPVNQVYRIASGTPGQVYGNLIIEGASTGEQYLSPPGDIRAYNVITGKKVWQFHTIPHPGDPGYSTWPKGSWKYAGGADPWADMAVDQTQNHS